VKPFVFAAAAILLAASPSLAETRPKLFGGLAGNDYCRYRVYGVPHDVALERAMRENLSTTMTEETLGYGKYANATPGIIDMVETTLNRCPQLLPIQSK